MKIVREAIMEKSVTKDAVPTVLVLRGVMRSMVLVGLGVRSLKIQKIMIGGSERDVTS